MHLSCHCSAKDKHFLLRFHTPSSGHPNTTTSWLNVRISVTARKPCSSRYTLIPE